MLANILAKVLKVRRSRENLRLWKALREKSVHGANLVKKKRKGQKWVRHPVQR